MSAPRITPAMTLLDVVHAYPSTAGVFRSRDKAAGVCLLCTALFDSIEAVATAHGFDLEALLGELNQAAGEKGD